MTIGLALRAIGYAIAAMALNVGTAFLVVFIYSLIEPGHDQAFYQAFAERAAPISAIVAGIPILFGFGWLIGRGRSRHTAIGGALLLAAVYVAIDLAIILAAAGLAAPWDLILLSYATKVVAAVLGARQALRSLSADAPSS